MSYKWTDASTTEGRERLKELLDSGSELPMRINPVLRPEFEHAKNHGWAFKRTYHYSIWNHCVPFEDWNAGIGLVWCQEGMEFLDPSPRLEPPELQWKPIHEYMDIATHNGWEFSVSREGWWWVKKDGKMLGYNEAALRGDEDYHGDMDTAKAAIHEWRVNHLKSILG